MAHPAKRCCDGGHKNAEGSESGDSPGPPGPEAKLPVERMALARSRAGQTLEKLVSPLWFWTLARQDLRDRLFGIGRAALTPNLDQPFYFFFPPLMPIAVRQRALTLLALLRMHAVSC
jgi:hypothetical protein